MSRVRKEERTAPRLATRPGALAPSEGDEPARDDEFSDELSSETVTAVLGTASRRGEWEPADITRVFVLMGNATLDFRRALLPEGVTEVQVFTLLGKASIVVPEGLGVEVTGNALLGDFQQSSRVSRARRLLRRTLRAARGGDPYDDEPEVDEDPAVLRVTGLAVLGNVEVIVRP